VSVRILKICAMAKKIKKAACAVDYAFQRIGGKYKARILWVLRDGVLRYGELKKAIVGITPKMLTQTLKELEEDKLVVRKAYYEIPPKVEYRISDCGKELIPFIALLRGWGEKQLGLKIIQRTNV
jgi:DNA-binding HxlR family transcriptional regulator